MQLLTDLLGCKVRLLDAAPHTARVGWVRSVWLTADGDRCRYTIMLKDGRLLEGLASEAFVIER